MFDTAGFLRSLPLTGAAARTLYLNKHLHALGCEITLLLCDLNPESRPTKAWPLPVSYLRYEALYEQPDTLAAQLKELAPDILVMSNTQLLIRYGRAIADAAGCALIYELHDNEGAVIHSIGGSHGEIQAATILQAAAIKTADGVVAFTDRDAALALSLRTSPSSPLGVGAGAAVHIVPCGVEPDPPPGQPAPDRLALAFVGNLYYEPNLRALRYLRRSLAPAMHPFGCSIEVLGRYPRAVRRLAAPGVMELRGPVPDLRAALATATVGVAPLDSGGGMKLKVLEYMAAGLPVVGTSEAFAGIATPQQFALVATSETMADFPELVAALLTDEELRRRLGAAGRRLAEQIYSWRSVATLARHAYGAILGLGVGHVEGVHGGGQGAAALPAEVVELASQPPYWLNEWRSHEDPEWKGTSVADFAAGQQPTVVGRLAEAIDCARLAAESALGTTFNQDVTVGYGGRSMVFFAADAVLKVYTHRWSERLGRELAGLRLAAGLAGVRVPAVLGHGDVAGSLSWVACSRLAGTLATEPRWSGSASSEQLGRLAARLHSLPQDALVDLPPFGRNVREVPATNPDAHRAGMRLSAALEKIERRNRRQCVRGFVHGDFSGRNGILEEGLAPGVIDFEGCGAGCVYEDLATLYVRDVLMGSRSAPELLDAYEDERAILGLRLGLGLGSSPLGANAAMHGRVDERHLLFHTAWYARWVLQWAAEIDAPMAAEVNRLVPRLLTGLELEDDATS